MAERKSVSMQDLADKLGISKVTVSKALNGKDGVGEELKEKIFALARESGYVLPDYGKRKSKKVGIIMSPRFSSGDEGKFYMAMYERIIYELQRASCSSIMISPTTATLPSDMNTIQTRGLFVRPDGRSCGPHLRHGKYGKHRFEQVEGATSGGRFDRGRNESGI